METECFLNLLTLKLIAKIFDQRRFLVNRFFSVVPVMFRMFDRFTLVKLSQKFLISVEKFEKQSKPFPLRN